MPLLLSKNYHEIRTNRNFVSLIVLNYYSAVGIIGRGSNRIDFFTYLVDDGAKGIQQTRSMYYYNQRNGLSPPEKIAREIRSYNITNLEFILNKDSAEILYALQGLSSITSIQLLIFKLTRSLLKKEKEALISVFRKAKHVKTIGCDINCFTYMIPIMKILLETDLSNFVFSFPKDNENLVKLVQLFNSFKPLFMTKIAEVTLDLVDSTSVLYQADASSEATIASSKKLLKILLQTTTSRVTLIVANGEVLLDCLNLSQVKHRISIEYKNFYTADFKRMTLIFKKTNLIDSLMKYFSYQGEVIYASPNEFVRPLLTIICQKQDIQICQTLMDNFIELCHVFKTHEGRDKILLSFDEKQVNIKSFLKKYLPSEFNRNK